MASPLISLYYHPTEIVVVDDDLAFMQSIALKLLRKKIKIFTEPTTVVQYLAEPHPEVSVLISDFHIPEMNGLELLARLNNFSGKRMLITGEQDYKVGVDAFNQGLIHTYVRKDDPHFTENLISRLQELEWQYFIEKTTVEILKQEEFKNLFFNANCAKTFQAILNQHHITDFKWSDKLPGFILKDNAGQKRYLLVQSQVQLNNLIITAEEDGASPHVVEQIKTAKAIPFVGEDQEFWQVKASEWEQYLLPRMCQQNEWSFFIK